MLTFTLSAQIPSGKNQVKETYTKSGKKVKYSDQRFKLWRKDAGNEILLQKSKWSVATKMSLPLLGPLAMTVGYYPQDKTVRDLPGMLDAICHLLEYCELIENDKQIEDLHWTTLPFRAGPPCITLEVRAVE